MNKLLAYLQQPSTRTGAGMMLVALSNFAPYPYSWLMLGIAVAIGGVEVLRNEKKAAPHLKESE